MSGDWGVKDAGSVEDKVNRYDVYLRGRWNVLKLIVVITEHLFGFLFYFETESCYISQAATCWDMFFLPEGMVQLHKVLAVQPYGPNGIGL